MAFVWQIKGRQSFEGTHCCYGDSSKIMWLALLVLVKAKASVISSRHIRRQTNPVLQAEYLTLYCIKGEKTYINISFSSCNQY